MKKLLVAAAVMLSLFLFDTGYAQEKTKQTTPVKYTSLDKVDKKDVKKAADSKKKEVAQKSMKTSAVKKSLKKEAKK